jgi:hypothetical protein
MGDESWKVVVSHFALFGNCSLKAVHQPCCHLPRCSRVMQAHCWPSGLAPKVSIHTSLTIPDFWQTYLTFLGCPRKASEFNQQLVSTLQLNTAAHLAPTWPPLMTTTLCPTCYQPPAPPPWMHTTRPKPSPLSSVSTGCTNRMPPSS